MTRRLRLLSIGHSYAIGANRALPQALQKVSAERWEVTIGAPTLFKGHRDLRSASLKVDEAETVRVVPLRAYNTSQIHIFWYGLDTRALLQQDWDLVHCWEEPYILAGALLARWTPARTKFVFRTAQSLNKSYPPPFNWLERYTLSRSSGWICSGRTVEENLLQRAKYDQVPHTLAPLGVDLSRFSPNGDAGHAIRQKLDWNDDGPPIIGYYGRFVPEKGLELLIRVLEQLNCPWRAMLVGGGPMTEYLQAQATRWPDRLRVLTDVHHDQMPGYLNAADLMVLPSQTAPHWREQFGRIIVEAFASGLPVIGSDSGEIPFVIGQAGMVVPEADEHAWQLAIEQLLQSPEQRAEFARRGLERAPEYAWSNIATKLLGFFDQLVA